MRSVRKHERLRIPLGTGFRRVSGTHLPTLRCFPQIPAADAPAHVPGKDFLFFGRCKALFKLDSLQCPYRIHVHAKLRFRAAMTEGVVRNAEVGFLGRFCRLPLLGTNGLNNNIVGQVVFLCGNDFNCFGYRPGCGSAPCASAIRRSFAGLSLSLCSNTSRACPRRARGILGQIS